MNPKHKFDFLTQTKTKNIPIEFFNLSFRVVRFKISDKTIETLITNLNQENFDADEIKKLYNMRKVNFSVAVKIIRRYFLDKLELFELEVLIEKFILPIRKGRKNPRKFLLKRKAGFTYR